MGERGGPPRARFPQVLVKFLKTYRTLSGAQDPKLNAEGFGSR